MKPFQQPSSSRSSSRARRARPTQARGGGGSSLELPAARWDSSRWGPLCERARARRWGGRLAGDEDALGRGQRGNWRASTPSASGSDYCSAFIIARQLRLQVELDPRGPREHLQGPGRPPTCPNSEVTTDYYYMLDRLVIAGTPSQVVEAAARLPRGDRARSGRSSTAGSTGSTRGLPGVRSSWRRPRSCRR